MATFLQPMPGSTGYLPPWAVPERRPRTIPVSQRVIPEVTGRSTVESHIIDADERSSVIESLLVETPLEDGVPHAVEGTLRGWLLADSAAGRSIETMIRCHTDRNLAADLLLAVARLGLAPATTPWLREAVRAALGDRHLAVRHAAVKAIELLEDAEMKRHLDHFEPAEPWLRSYVARLRS